MDTSRRAVESYWRSRMVDAVTSDEDKVAPVYKLEEMCDLLRSSHPSIVKEFSEFILKRLENKSPIVKQKALRLIKYAVGNSGPEFRREMQRNSVAVRNMFHYKGHPDPLKGDALNKAVRDTAHETISAIFSEENSSKPAASESINRRIEGFGNTNFQPQVSSNDNKSFLSEVVGLGSASIKQGISNFAQGHLPRKNENGSSSYRGPNLHRSLTMESENFSRYDPVKLGNDGNYGMSNNTSGGSWGHGSAEASESSASVRVESKTREEKLLETIVTSGGVRLQPTRDALHVFILEAAKMDTVVLSIALDAKLQSPMWQVRMKALCVLEAILRKKEDDNFSVVHTYFTENMDSIQRCSEFPQSSLREKANRVLSLLNSGQSSGLMSSSDNTSKREAAVDLPDLIDTGDSDYTTEDTFNKSSAINPGSTAGGTAVPLMDDDWFGDSTDAGLSSSEKKNDEDPFADVSFHRNEKKENADDLFLGMTVGEKPAAGGNHVPELFDMFGSTAQLEAERKDSKNINDLMASFSIDEKSSNQKGSSSSTLTENLFAMPSTTSNQAPEVPVGGMLGSQSPGLIQNPMVPGGGMPFNFPPGMMMNQSFASQPLNYAAMASLLAQQQYLGNISNFQQFGNLNAYGSGHVHPMGTSGGNESALPDIFQQSFANQAPTSTMNGSKREDTKAFDFISVSFCNLCRNP